MNIKAFLRSVLMNPEIINLTGDKTVHFIHANSPVAPYVEYLIYDEEGALFAEGKEIATEYYIQVDIFSKGDYTEIETKIKEKMIAAGFTGGHGAGLYEEDTGLNHKAMRFIYSINID